MSDVATTVLRRPAARPSWSRVVARSAVVTVVTAVALWILAALLPGLWIDRPRDALLAGLVVGLVGSIVWPALAFIIVPISVLTLGLGAIVLEALVVALVLDSLPGIHLDGFWTAILVALGLAAVTTLVSTLLAVDDDSWFDQTTARRARRRAGTANVTDVPGVVFIQLDGVAHPVLERALRSGDAPTLHRWIRDGSHNLTAWQTGWSSQTGVSQCGILHGSTVDMPAFRWVDKSTGDVVVSNHRKWAAAIEHAHSDGEGLLAHNGSSYGNLFSGDAERAVLTMSGAGRRKEGRVGAGYFGYFSRPQQAARTMLALFAEVGRERRAAGLQRRRNVEPRVHRSWTYALLRAFTTVVSRDVSVQGVINDMCEGRAAIYVDLLGYDEVSHHSGPERAEHSPCCATSTGRSVASNGRASGRPVHIGSWCCPITVRPRVRRSSNVPARRWRSSSLGCAAVPHRVTPTPKRVVPNRRPGYVRRATRTRRRRRWWRIHPSCSRQVLSG